MLLVLNVTCVAAEDSYSMHIKAGVLFSVKNMLLSNEKLITTKLRVTIRQLSWLQPEYKVL